MFEVGKKYKSKRSSKIFTCIGVYSKDGWLLNINNSPSTYSWDQFHWEEYIEPPPEDWRALFYDKEFNQADLSNASYQSQKEVLKAWGTSSDFVKAVRVDGGDT